MERLPGEYIHIPTLVEVVIRKIFDTLFPGDTGSLSSQIFEPDIRVHLGYDERSGEYRRQKAKRSRFHSQGQLPAENRHERQYPGHGKNRRRNVNHRCAFQPER